MSKLIDDEVWVLRSMVNNYHEKLSEYIFMSYEKEMQLEAFIEISHQFCKKCQEMIDELKNG